MHRAKEKVLNVSGRLQGTVFLPFHDLLDSLLFDSFSPSS